MEKARYNILNSNHKQVSKIYINDLVEFKQFFIDINAESFYYFDYENYISIFEILTKSYNEYIVIARINIDYHVSLCNNYNYEDDFNLIKDELIKKIEINPIYRKWLLEQELNKNEIVVKKSKI
jgi:hypothetical protein